MIGWRVSKSDIDKRSLDLSDVNSTNVFLSGLPHNLLCPPTLVILLSTVLAIPILVSRSALAIARWGDHTPMFISIPFPSPATFFRESKDSAELPWEVLLEIEREHSLLHVCADLLKDHGSEGGWVVLSATETSRQVLPSANYVPIDHKEKKNLERDKVFGKRCKLLLHSGE